MKNWSAMGLVLLVCLVGSVFADARRPNIIIIFTDDQGYQDLGCFGSPDIKTPRIDRMAQEGMRFTSFYAQTVCGPSRAALMTGCYPIRLARQADPDSIHPELHSNETTIAEVRAPGRIPAGTECQAVTATIDMMPTIAGLAGGTAPADRVIDGVDIAALMHGKTDALERNYFYYQHDCLRAVRAGKWKLMLPHTEPVQASIATKWRNHIAKADGIRIQEARLYDLDADIGETTDVSDKYPETVAELMKLVESAKKEVGDHDRFGASVRTFGAKRRTLSGDAKVAPAKKKKVPRKGKS